MSSEPTFNPSPKLSASILSILFFGWLFPLLQKGSRKELDSEDIYDALPEDKLSKLGEELCEEWKKEIQHKNKKDDTYKPSLFNALARMFWKKWAMLGIILFVEECGAKIAQPLFLAYLLKYFNGDFEDKHVGYYYATGVIFSVMFYTISHHPSFFSIIHLNTKIRIACSALLYHKTLTISQQALSDVSVGKVINLLSNDITRFDFCLNFLHYLWIGPFQLLISVGILWHYFGPACLTGIFFLMLYTPFQSFMGHLFSKLRFKVALKTDKRIRIMNEIISGIRVLKMYAWEIPFSKMVAEARENEIKSVGRQMILRALNLALYYVSSKVIIFLTLMTYLLGSNALTAEKVFVTMALYQNVRLLMTIFFPWGISFLAETRVSFRRIEDFLLKDDFNKNSTSSTEITPSVIVQNLSAKWNSELEEYCLKSINLEAINSKLIIIVGPVGSGKSAILQAIMQELPLCDGKLQVNGCKAYVPQDPWIFNGSIRQNILFGKKYLPVWYKIVVEACALDKDFASMAHKDKTIVGDKGISLSGGQKARVNLARAVYANADIYLLDDPLSAVDAEVGRHLFEKCIRGVLKCKIVILTTHQLQFVKLADKVYLISNGKIENRGLQDQIDVSFADCEQYQQDKKRRESIIQDLNGRKVSVDSESKFRKDSVLSEEMGSQEALAETTFSGSIGCRQYWKYISNGSNICFLLFVMLSNVLTQVIYNGCDFWLQHWIRIEQSIFQEKPQEPLLFYNSSDSHSMVYSNGSDTDLSIDSQLTVTSDSNKRHQMMHIYTLFIAVLFVMTILRTLGFFKLCMQSSVSLHSELFTGIIRAPMYFFENNPTGRVLNRFTKDIGTIDELLPYTLFDTLEVGLQVIGVIVVVCIVKAIFLVPSIVIAIMFYFIRNFFQKTSRHLKRLEGAARSPIFNHLSVSLNGLAVIRAFEVENHFKEQFGNFVDFHSSVFYLFHASARLLGIIVDWISIFYITSVVYGVVYLELDGASAGLAISSAMSLTSWFQWGVRQSAEAENQMVSLERILEYSEITSEANLDSVPNQKPPSTWPSNGEIEFKNVSVTYPPAETPFFNNLTFKIKSREKIGICGRTGSGKTSLISVLFRLVEPSRGSIFIDNINVLEIGLHDLRSILSVIPQDPVLFQGTLRKNLDPLEEHSDEKIMETLKLVHLIDIVNDSPMGLSYSVSEGGSNFSVGQRQLMCMGRSLLRQTKILVMDEATANVDQQTDEIIQKTIREQFANCTVLTIAHRLHTVMDSDRIMMLENGKILEFENPYYLISSPESALRKLVDETGSETSKELITLARKHAVAKKGTYFCPVASMDDI